MASLPPGPVMLAFAAGERQRATEGEDGGGGALGCGGWEKPCPKENRCWPPLWSAGFLLNPGATRSWEELLYLNQPIAFSTL